MKNRIKNILVLSVTNLLLIILKLHAQSPLPRFEKFDVEEGLSQSTVLCITQDSLGFLWIGTYDGLNRYDGYEFKIYKNDPSDSLSLLNNWIWSLYVDRQGTLWIGSKGGGLNRYDHNTDTFIPYKHNPDDPHSLSGKTVNSIIEDKYGMLWIGTSDGGLNRLDRETNKFYHYRYDPNNPNSLSSNYVRCFLEDSNGNLWIGTWRGGLNRYKRETDDFEHYQRSLKNPYSLHSDTVQTICEDKNGELWIASWNKGMDCFDPETNRFQHYQYEPSVSNGLNNNALRQLFIDSAGFLWISAYGGGLNRMNIKDQTFQHFLHHPENGNSIPSNNIACVFEDRSHIIWIGTIFEGLAKYDPKLDQFNHIYHDPSNPNSLSSNHVWAIYQDTQDLLWIGTSEGLDHYNPGDNKFVNIKLNIGNQTNLHKMQLESVLEDRQGSMWITFTETGVLQYDRISKRLISYYSANPEDEHLSNIREASLFLEDHLGDIWIGSWGDGLERYNYKENKFYRYEYDPENPDGVLHHSIHDLYEDNYGTLWIGTSIGLDKYDRKNDRFIHYQHDPNDPYSLSSKNQVCSICETDDGYLWIGTENGLNKFDRKTERFNHYFMKDGLPNDFIYCIKKADDGCLWLSTNKGLSKFDPRTEIFRNYDRSDGLQGNEFNAKTCYKSSDGEMFFGGMNGFNHFYPSDIRDNPYIPKMVITDIKIFGESFKSKDYYSDFEHIELLHSQNFISFEFVGLEFSVPGKNQYAYMLKGLDKDWIYAGHRRFANYTDVHPGEYEFIVKGSNNDGVWNKTGVSLKLIINPPFWQTWWFRSCSVLLISGILFLLHNYRVRKRLELEGLRTRIASDLHDDIGTTLTKIVVHSEIIQTTKDSKYILRAAQRIGAWSREITVTMSDIVWSIDARNDTVGDMIDRMRNLGESTLSPKNISFHFEMKGLNQEHKIKVDLRQNIYLIFKEAINNIAKHSEASKVRVTISNKQNNFIMLIEDDGTGFDENKVRPGNGLKNIRLRAERIDASVRILYNNGTIIELKMKAIQ